MSNHFKVGIDIGTYQVKVVIADTVLEKDRQYYRIIGVGFAESKGMRHGYIINPLDAARSIQSAVAQAERAAGVKVKKAHIGVGGIGLSSVTAQGTAIISRADSEITDLDVNKAILESENEITKSLANRKIIHTIPLSYKIDGKIALGRPQGMKGMKLEVKALFITCLDHHVTDIIQAVEEAGVEVEDVIASPVAAGLVMLNKVQKVAGCVLANIGAETVSIIVYEDNIPISLEVFPIGSTDITNDIALGLKIPLEDAEEIKMRGIKDATFSRKKLDEIIEARLSDIFELVEAHLQKIGKNGLLPAGIIITGGGSGLDRLKEFAKDSLKLPSKIGVFSAQVHSRTPIKDATWAVAYGLCILAFSGGDDIPKGLHVPLKNSFKRAGSWIKKFLP